MKFNERRRSETEGKKSDINKQTRMLRDNKGSVLKAKCCLKTIHTYQAPVRALLMFNLADVNVKASAQVVGLSPRRRRIAQ